jgi:hypothetical protein
LDIDQIVKKLKSESVITALSASFLLSVTLCFFSPATLYYTNFFEFNYTFSDICPYLIVLTFFFGISLTIFSSLFKEKTHKRIVCIIFTLALLLYVQGNILVWDYGLFDGHEIIWNNYFINGLFEIVIFIGIIILSFLMSEKIYKFIPVVCLFLIVIQTGGFLALVFSAPEEPQWKSYSFVYDESEFEFSENSNVIIIVLDAYQSDVFQEIINEDDDFKNIFTGFTYYRNAVGGYPSTVASIPLILTGKYFNNSEPFDTFIKKSYESTSLPKTLKENGYIVDIYGHPNGYTRLVYPNEDLESNAKQNYLNHEIMLPHLLTLGKLSIFRESPHFFKEATYSLLIEVYQEKKSSRFINQFKKQSIRLIDTPTFKFYHLDVPHMPFLLNEDLEYEKLPNNRSGYKEQAKASIHIVGDLLETLKENEIFDKSIIIVVADHGVSNNAYGMNLSQIPSKDQISYVSQNVVTGGLPLMLVKPFNSTHPFVISDAPVSTSDIPKSVATELNISNTFTGESVYSIRESDTRNFTFYHYFLTKEYYYGEYLPPLKEYNINNFSWYASSWQPTYRIYTSNGVEIHTPPDYKLGTTIKFGKEQEPQDFMYSGWSTPEEDIVWSDGKSATIAFSMNRSNSTLMNVQITAFPYIVDRKHETQRVTVYLNKNELGSYLFSQPQTQQMDFLIYPEYLNEQVQYLTFDIPDAISPWELGISKDSRNLGIALSSFTVNGVNRGQN